MKGVIFYPLMFFSPPILKDCQPADYNVVKSFQEGWIILIWVKSNAWQIKCSVFSWFFTWISVLTVFSFSCPVPKSSYAGFLKNMFLQFKRWVNYGQVNTDFQLKHLPEFECKTSNSRFEIEIVICFKGNSIHPVLLWVGKLFGCFCF